MTDKMKQFLEEAGKDAAFAEKLNGAPSAETVIALAKEKGFELNEADLQIEAAAGELDDAELDDVTGGSSILSMGKAWWKIFLTFIGQGNAADAANGGGVTAGDPAYRGGGAQLGDLAYRGGGAQLGDLTYRGDQADDGAHLTSL